MEYINAWQTNTLTFTPKKQGDLLYHDGPLLSHFIDEKIPDDNYLYRWVDSDNEVNRWLVFKVLAGDLLRFFEGEMTLLNLITDSKLVTLLDLNDDLEAKNIQITTVENLPAAYLPAETSTFKSSFYEEYALVLKENLCQIPIQKKDETTENLLEKVRQLESQQDLILSALNGVLARVSPSIQS